MSEPVVLYEERGSVAIITLNQIIGPVAFKFALNAVGEARSRPDRRIRSRG